MMYIDFQEELLAVNMRKLEEMAGELGKSHQDELDELRQTLARQYEGTH